MRPLIISESTFKLTIPLESGRQMVVGIPVTIRIEDAETSPPIEPPEPPPIESSKPTELIAKYWQNASYGADRMVEFWIPHWIATDADGHVGQLRYDGIHMLMMLAYELDVVKFRDAAVELHERWVYPKVMANPETGLPGYYNYNAGMIDVSVRADLPDTTKYLAFQSATQFAMHSAYSRPATIKKSKWPFTAQLAREIANGLMSHLQLIRLDDIRQDQRDYISSATMAIADTYIPQWVRVCSENHKSQMKNPANEVAPFIMALAARSLIKSSERRFISVPSVVESLSALGHAIYPLLWRMDSRGAGFLYRPGRGVTASADLALLVFPWFAWLTEHSIDPDRSIWSDVANDLFALGVQHGYISGYKQFNQGMLWSREGMRWMGWG